MRFVFLAAIAATSRAFHPFAANESAAYVASDKVAKHNAMVASLVQNVTATPRARRAVAAALSAGVAWNAYGVSFPAAYAFGTDADEAFGAACGRTAVEKCLVVHDHAARALPDASNAIARAIEADGFARIDDWGLGARALDDIAADFEAEVSHSGVPGVLTRTGVLGARAAFLNNTRLRAGVQAYLGNDAKLTNALALRLTNSLRFDEKNWRRGYLSALWHHDRCGRRLKAFLFLNDVSEGGRPTVVARGSHKTLFYAHDAVPLSRFDAAYVNASYDTVPMYGKRGGGFVFDTNSVHRGLPEGVRERRVLIADFIQGPKMAAFERLRFNGPCGQPGRKP